MKLQSGVHTGKQKIQNVINRKHIPYSQLGRRLTLKENRNWAHDISEAYRNQNEHMNI